MTDASNLIILDRDGVINHDSDDYIKSPDEWLPIDGSLDAIADLGRAGFKLVVVTNQSGIARGLMSEETLDQIHRKMISEVESHGGRLSGIFYCPHGPDDECRCRKPRTGMHEDIMSQLGVSLENVPTIGDSKRDLDAAMEIGARPILVLTGYGRGTLEEYGDNPPETFDDLASAAAALIKENQNPSQQD